MTTSGSAVAPRRDGDPERIGPYAVVGVLGAGGMGRVYLGRDDRGRPAAVKVIRPELATDPAFRVRFRGEVEAARRVPARVTAQVLDADPEADRPWVATRYLPGPSLDRQVREHGPLSGRALRRVAAGLLDGLVAVHGAGLVHRDLKPSNVLLTRRGPRIVDFGIARAADRTRITTTGRLVGTPAYMSPEQALGDGPVGPAGDVHALGSVLVFAATGRAPFAAPSAAAVLFRVLHGEPDLGGTPEPVRGWAARCLTRDPADRPSPETLRAELRRPARRRAAAVAGGLVAAAVVGGVLLWPGLPSGSGGVPTAAPTAAPTPAPVTAAGPAVDPRVPGGGPAVSTAPDRPAATVS
ncbi:MAG: serine/threonine-protein kinase, partial [Pseudonocardia sediminis]